MKTIYNSTLKVLFVIVVSVFFTFEVNAVNDNDVIIIKGKVVDMKTQEFLPFATVGVQSTNIATVTNSEGVFLLKVPTNHEKPVLFFSFMGYKTQVVSYEDIKLEKVNVFKLEPIVINLSEIKVMPNSSLELINEVMAKRKENYPESPNVMTAFYRETIKKKRTYVGLSEAVVEVYKQPYTNTKDDLVRLVKGRKGSDVSKIDTLLFKLQGGAHTTLMLDVMKDPYMILDRTVQHKYDYVFENITTIDNNLFYIISFSQKEGVEEPMFYGKMYINAESMAISNLIFSLNTSNKKLASDIFIKKKPGGVIVYPTEVSYFVNYKNNDNKWYFNYSRADVTFHVKWKKKLFNTNYTISSEMAVTDREVATEKPFKASEGIRGNAVMNDEVKGFVDKDFWGEYNVIEPEKSINTAIKKIAKSMKKIESEK